MARTPFQRTDRVSSLLREVLAELIAREVKDPRVADLTLTDVEVTGDLREARIYVCGPQDERGQKAALAGLDHAAGFLRRELGRRIRMRVTPSLEFRWDASLDYGARIEARLRELGLGEPEAEERPEDDEPGE